MANVKISGLPAATSVTAGTDVAPLVSGGITTKATPQQIVNAGLAAPGAIGGTTRGTAAFTTELVGPSASANFTRFPNALTVISNTSAGIQQNETHNMGIMAEGTANAADTSIYGVGVYGVGYTASGTRCGGVIGEGHVSASADTGSAIGVRGYANDTHAGGLNIGLYGDCANGSSNYALYLNNGDIYTAGAKTWTLNGNLTFSGTYTVTVPTLSVSTTLSGTGITNYFASPPAIGSGTASTGAFTTLSASSTVSGTGFSTYLLSPPAIGTTTPAAGKFTTLEYTSTLTGGTGVIAIGTNQIYKDSSGNVGIGTASPSTYGKFVLSGGSSAIDPQLTIESTAFNASQGSALNFARATQTQPIQARISVADNGASASNLIFSTKVDGTAGALTSRMTIDSSGALTVPNIYTNTTAAVTYVAVNSIGLLQRGGVSALKYKQDIRDIELIDINKFRPVRYKSKCENDDQTIDYFGFIADEVEEAGIKELVIYNDDGEPEGFQYERMTVVLLKAIQELSIQISDLKTELNELKAKVNVNV